jgi:hypothetical protein
MPNLCSEGHPTCRLRVSDPRKALYGSVRYGLRSDAQVNESQDRAAIEKQITDYAAGMKIRVSPVTAFVPENAVLIITSSAGGIGSCFLTDLLAESSKCIFLEADTSQDQLGLSSAAYQEASSNFSRDPCWG